MYVCYEFAGMHHWNSLLIIHTVCLDYFSPVVHNSVFDICVLCILYAE